MTREELMNVLSEMKGRLFALTSSDKKIIENNHEIVLRQKFTKTGCGDCYRDAIILMINYLKKNDIMEKKSNYQLKPGVIIHIIGMNNVFSNHNLTDEAAETFLKNNPKGIKMFTYHPEDWESKVEKLKNKKDNGKENNSEKSKEKTVLKVKQDKEKPSEDFPE